jgi:peptidoglycan L-alanyl-D-glutamate endopeptidase CwlK
MRSRHLTGHAVDLAACVGKQVRWDWPLYERLNVAIQKASEEFMIPVEWGGLWASLKDGPHWQLPWSHYPAEAT